MSALIVNDASASIPAVQLQQDGPPYPQHGWRVCEDLGVGNPPGGPSGVQIMALCQGEGWRVQAYCLEPADPAPPIDAFCSLVGDRTFWCGDEYQMLREYIILQTPQPTETFTATATVTFTPTATLTPTVTLTVTGTPLPTQTSTTVPAATDTMVASAAASPTVFYRPAPGGSGNRGLFIGLVILAGGLMAFGAAGILRWRRSI